MTDEQFNKIAVLLLAQTQALVDIAAAVKWAASGQKDADAYGNWDHTRAILKNAQEINKLP